MTLKEAKRVLVEHNKWRTGEGEYSEAGSKMPFSPRTITDAIEIAIQAIERVERL